MANTLNNTLNKINSAANALKTLKPIPTNDKVVKGASNLERFGMEARKEQLHRNEWKKDLAYSKPLVDAEYMIQTEFKVSSYEDRLNEQAQASADRAAEKAEAKAKKQAEKKAKKAEKQANKEKTKEDRKESKETINKSDVTKIQAQHSIEMMRMEKKPF